MRIALTWPFGRYQPGDVVDVDQRIADVLTREGFARIASQPAPPVQPQAPSIADLRTYAATHGCSLTEARDLMAAALEARPGPLTQPATQEAPPCA